MNHLNKIVFTKTLKKVTWNNSEIAKGNLKEEVLTLKEQPGKDIVIFGSGSIVSGLIILDLIDELRVGGQSCGIGRWKHFIQRR